MLEQSLKQQTAAIEGFSIKALQFLKKKKYEQAKKQLSLFNLQARKLYWRRSGLKSLPDHETIKDSREKLKLVRADAKIALKKIGSLEYKEAEDILAVVVKEVEKVIETIINEPWKNESEIKNILEELIPWPRYNPRVVVSAIKNLSSGDPPYKIEHNLKVCLENLGPLSYPKGRDEERDLLVDKFKKAIEPLKRHILTEYSNLAKYFNAKYKEQSKTYAQDPMLAGHSRIEYSLSVFLIRDQLSIINFLKPISKKEYNLAHYWIGETLKAAVKADYKHLRICLDLKENNMEKPSDTVEHSLGTLLVHLKECGKLKVSLKELNIDWSYIQKLCKQQLGLSKDQWKKVFPKEIT